MVQKAQQGEFSIIDRFFTHEAFGAWCTQGVGDDCALIDVGEKRIAVTTDMTAVGTHFPPDASAFDIGWKALTVNLSDLAAAGAVPRAFFLAIGLPQKDEAWLSEFSAGLMSLAREAGCPLMGGDTTKTPSVGDVRTPATITITAMGELPSSMGLTRRGARPGDDIWVSGTLGAAAAALKHRLGEWTLSADVFPAADKRLNHPEARLALGRALLPVATACADVSDGLAQDLGHILERSGVAADVFWDAVPVDAALAGLTDGRRREAAMAGGDDYELVFTAPAAERARVEQAAISAVTPVSRIGRIREADGTERLLLKDAAGGVLALPVAGFDHFAG